MALTLSKNLSDVKNGCTVTIVGLRSTGAVRKRLLDMGLVRGVRVRVERSAPLGDPVEISLKGYSLALRRTEARQILVEEG
jgi:Fe2+ transport system protein FeoA